MGESDNLAAVIAGGSSIDGVAALPHKSRHTAIVNTCSIAAYAGPPNRALHSASQEAVHALTLAADRLADGIRVNCVNPGTVDTPWVQRPLAAADDPDAEPRTLPAAPPTRIAVIGRPGHRSRLKSSARLPALAGHTHRPPATGLPAVCSMPSSQFAFGRLTP